MEKRYFYDCPLKAAYMKKHHGMKLQVHHSFENEDYGFLDVIGIYEYDEAWGDIEYIQAIKQNEGYGEQSFQFDPDCGKVFYIHPDSVPLLEPQMGDVIKQWGSLAGVPIYDIGERNGNPVYFMPDSSYNYFESMEKIIQRDGKPFFWPEREKEEAA